LSKINNFTRLLHFRVLSEREVGSWILYGARLMARMGKGKKKRPIQQGGGKLEGLSASSAVARSSVQVIRSDQSTQMEIEKPQGKKSETVSNQIVICKFPTCHDIVTTHGFCRFHYLASWKKLKTK